MFLKRLAALLLLTVPLACGSDDTAAVPKVNRFEASATNVTAGSTVTLHYEVEDATSVSIDATPGSALLDGGTESSGMVTSAALTGSTVFVITATGPGGSASKAVSVTVTAGGAGPTIESFTATPRAIDPGASVTLSWKVTSATSVKIDVLDGAMVVAGGTRFESTERVTPAVTTTYVLSAMGAGGMRTAEVTVIVRGAGVPTVATFDAAPTAITRGQASTLTWAVLNAERVTIRDAANAMVYDGTNLSGTAEVRPTATETYTLVATRGADTSRASRTVTVNPAAGARVITFYATPDTISPGLSSTLRWEVASAPGGIEIRARGRTATTSAALSGSFTVTPTASTDYTLIAKHPDGDATAVAHLQIAAGAPVVADFEATPNPGPLGGDTVLRWRVLGADRVRVLRESPDREVLRDVPATTRTTTLAAALRAQAVVFRLEASNGTGSTVARVVVAAQGRPLIERFTATPGVFTGTATVTLSWRVVGASSVAATQNGMPLASFPGTSTGTLSLRLTATARFELIATSAAGETRANADAAQLVGELEPNDTSSTAATLTLMSGAGAALGAFSRAGDVDVYAVMVGAGGSIRATTSDGMGGCAADTQLTLIAPDGMRVLGTRTSGGAQVPAPGFGACAVIDPITDRFASALPAGRYFVAVALEMSPPPLSFPAPYVLQITVGVPACGNRILDGGEQCDDGNRSDGDGCNASCRLEQVGMVMGPPSTTTFTGNLPAGTQDTYRIEMAAPGSIRAATFVPGGMGCTPGTMGDTFLTLVDSSGRELGTDDDDGPELCSLIDPLRDTFAAVPAGTYFLRVRPYQMAGAIAAYTVVITTFAIECGNGIADAGEGCDDGNRTGGDGCNAACVFEGANEVEPNDLAGAGTVLTSTGGLVLGTLADQADVDRFLVDVPAGWSFRASINSPNVLGCNTSPFAFDLTRQGQPVASSAPPLPGATDCGAIEPINDFRARNLPGGRYELRVAERLSAPARYVIHWAVIPPACGNRIPDGADECDDGGRTSGDGCDAQCRVESIPTIAAPGAAFTATSALASTQEVDLYRLVVSRPSYVAAAVFVPDPNASSCPPTTVISLTLYRGNISTEQTVPGSPPGDACAALGTGGSFVRLSTGTWFLGVRSGAAGAVPRYTLAIETAAADVCGNGYAEDTANEQCDDGNLIPGDGCSMTCALEIAGRITPPGGMAAISLPTATSFATVDVEITTPGQSITATAATGVGACTLAMGLSLHREDLSPLGGVAAPPEPPLGAGACPAFNAATPFAQDLAAGLYHIVVWNRGPASGAATVRVSVRNPACGNRVREVNAGEQCDDGNRAAGDGCSATCEIEVPGGLIQEVEPNDGTAQATVVPLSGAGRATLGGAISRVGDSDRFAIILPAGATYRVHARTYTTLGDPMSCTPSIDTRLVLTSAGGMELANNDDVMTGVLCSEIDTPGLAAGRYDLRVEHYNNANIIPAYYVDLVIQ